MIKRIFLLLVALVLFNSSYAQNDVIVLVDVSKSIKQQHFMEAREVVKNLLLGNPINNVNFTVNFDPRSSLKITKGQPLVSRGKKLIIFPFGESHRIYDMVNPKVVNSIPSDITSYFDQQYPRRVTDNKTYLELSKAKIAQIAKSQGLDKYVLILVSDNVHDDYGGSNSRPKYSKDQQVLLNNFNTASNPYSDTKQGTIDFAIESLYKISILTADITSWNPPPPPPIVQGDSIQSKVCELTLTSFPNGKKDKPKEVENNSVTLRWSAKNYPEGTRFTVSVRSTTGNNKNNISKSIAANSLKVDLTDDTYKVSVSSPICASTSTYIKVNAEGGGGLLFFFLVLAVLAGIGYWVFKRKQDEKMKRLSSDSFQHENVHYQADSSATDGADQMDGF